MLDRANAMADLNQPPKDEAAALEEKYQLRARRPVRWMPNWKSSRRKWACKLSNKCKNQPLGVCRAALR